MVFHINWYQIGIIMINNKSLVALCGCVDLLCGACPRQVTTEVTLSNPWITEFI